MSNTLTSVLIGVVSTLITLFLSSRLQHYFWDHQRMSELRLRALERLNSLAAEFLYNCLKDSNFQPDDQFFRSLMVLTADIKILFSQQAFDHFKELEVMIGPNMGPTGKANVAAFIDTQDSALRALYARPFRHASSETFLVINVGRPSNALEWIAGEASCYLRALVAGDPQRESVRPMRKENAQSRVYTRPCSTQTDSSFRLVFFRIPSGTTGR
jgi:hypothetical protein